MIFPHKFGAVMAIVLGSSRNNVSAFTVNPSPIFTQLQHGKGITITPSNSVVRHTDTRLYIIGPMIRKMREKQAEKNRPFASDEEKAVEAPGLKIGSGVWKWPPVFPYAPDFFYSLKEEKSLEAGTKNNPLSSAVMNTVGGGSGLTPGEDGVLAPGLKDAAELEKIEEESKLNAIQYWSIEKKDVLTGLDEEAAVQLSEHYSFYIKDGMSVLEFGAAENSYIPEGLKLERHVGVGLNQELMNSNPSLTETIIADLNEVIPEEGVTSQEIKKLGSDTFDAVLMANTVEFLSNPREVFRSAWNLVKPGGIMMVSFSERESMKEKFGDAQIKMWRNYNDDQHLWITGSFFHFSAGEGWAGLKGFDISPESAKNADDTNPLAKFTDRGKKNNMYVCQATKAAVVETIDENDPESSFSSLMWMTPTMESRDKKLVAPRLARAFTYFNGQPERQKNLQQNVDTLSDVYEALIKMDQFAFPFDLQANLAVDLVTDPDFHASEEQMDALKMGLGLKKPSEEFWAPVGQLTFSMDAEDKVNLLAHIVPRFGSNNVEQEEALQTFITGLKPTIAVIKSKCIDMSDTDAALVATELAASELLIPGRSTKEEFAAWMGELTDKELMEYAVQRKDVKGSAQAELQAMRDEREAEQKRKEEEERKWKEQVEKAREERTMVFNEKTGKMELKK